MCIRDSSGPGAGATRSASRKVMEGRGGGRRACRCVPWRGRPPGCQVAVARLTEQLRIYEAQARRRCPALLLCRDLRAQMRLRS
eukprot:11703312-Alexandrium_andersonii.AAC.1